MTRLLMLVEGQSEEIFVKQTLAPFLAEKGVHVESPIVLCGWLTVAYGEVNSKSAHAWAVARVIVPP